ncbi:hypothetical protein Tco_0925921 [Tanacetum coccineum]|uniref:Uncharacterized protein n=1 Tax=Tanacetum coccineum TaxID=301880 RepID=A0ABQ5D973_9ASTR
MVTGRECDLRSKSNAIVSNIHYIKLTTSGFLLHPNQRIQDNPTNVIRDARKENKDQRSAATFGRGYCRWDELSFHSASPKAPTTQRPVTHLNHIYSYPMQQGPGHTGLNSASQQPPSIPHIRPNRNLCPMT